MTVTTNNATTLLSQLEYVNDQAIGLLCEGLYDNAEALFSACLLISSGNHLESSNNKSNKSNNNSNVASAPHLRHLYGKQALILKMCLTHVLVDDDSPMHNPQEYFCFHNYVFGVDMVPNNYNDWHVFTAMMAYNRAVLHHGFGLMETSVARLHKARTLYQVAWRAAAQSSASALVELAIVNNLGHVSSYLGDVKGMQIYRDVLQHLLSLTSTPGLFHDDDAAWFATSLERARRVADRLAPAA